MKERRWKPESKTWNRIFWAEMLIYLGTHYILAIWIPIFKYLFPLHFIFIIWYFIARWRWYNWYRSCEPEPKVNPYYSNDSYKVTHKPVLITDSVIEHDTATCSVCQFNQKYPFGKVVFDDED